MKINGKVVEDVAEMNRLLNSTVKYDSVEQAERVLGKEVTIRRIEFSESRR